MYELQVLNKKGQHLYTYTGDNLGEAVQAGVDMLDDRDGAEYAYIIEKVTDVRDSAVFFHVKHVWFAQRQEKDDG